MNKLATPQQAYVDASKGTAVPQSFSSPFVCPFCAAFSQHRWGIVGNVTATEAGRGVTRQTGTGSPAIVLAECGVCKRESVFLGKNLVYPRAETAPLANPDMPPDVTRDFNEARAIVSASPRGAAALLRLAIQKLCPILGATKTEINAAIGELVAAGTINASLQKALDTVRVIGNESVHPGTIDLNDDPATAFALFNLVNFIVEKGITEPKQIDEIYSGLPSGKLAGIVQRDAPKTGS